MHTKKNSFDLIIVNVIILEVCCIVEQILTSLKERFRLETVLGYLKPIEIF